MKAQIQQATWREVEKAYDSDSSGGWEDDDAADAEPTTIADPKDLEYSSIRKGVKYIALSKPAADAAKSHAALVLRPKSQGDC